MPSVKDDKGAGLPLELIGPMIGGAGLSPELRAKLEQYLNDSIQDRIDARAREKKKKAELEDAGIEMARAAQEERDRKQRICGQTGHSKPRGETAVVGYRLSNGQYSWICQHCQALWFTPPGPQQVALPAEILQKINRDEVGG